MATKLKSKNRPGLWKIFNDADVETAKANGWEEVKKETSGKSKTKAKGAK